MTPGCVITGWNPSVKRLYGYSAGDAVGLQMSALTTPERSRVETAIVERVARGARMDRYETERIRKDGTRIDVSFSLSPIRTPDLGIVALASIERDITDVRQTQDALLEALAHFESAFKEAPIGMALV